MFGVSRQHPGTWVWAAQVEARRPGANGSLHVACPAVLQQAAGKRNKQLSCEGHKQPEAATCVGRTSGRVQQAVPAGRASTAWPLPCSSSACIGPRPCPQWGSSRSKSCTPPAGRGVSRCRAAWHCSRKRTKNDGSEGAAAAGTRHGRRTGRPAAWRAVPPLHNSLPGVCWPAGPGWRPTSLRRVEGCSSSRPTFSRTASGSVNQSSCGGQRQVGLGVSMSAHVEAAGAAGPGTKACPLQQRVGRQGGRQGGAAKRH